MCYAGITPKNGSTESNYTIARRTHQGIGIKDGTGIKIYFYIKMDVIKCLKFVYLLYIKKKNSHKIINLSILYMSKKQTIIKKPAGTGNISVTIENNLKNTNTTPPVVVKKKRRRNKAPTEEVNLPPPRPLPPLKDVSYIKPPSDRFTVWRDNLDDSFNTTIPQGQAQQMGLLRSLATPALTNQR
jgi:hypothetical protein